MDGVLTTARNDDTYLRYRTANDAVPTSGKLKVRSQQEVLQRRLTLEGILAIGAGNNPRVVEQKLNSFLAPRLRASLTG